MHANDPLSLAMQLIASVSKRLIICLLVIGVVAVLLSGCTAGPTEIYRDRPVEVRVPVPQPCAGRRPDAVAPLKETVGDDHWYARDVRQKAAAVGAQGLERQTYGEQLDAATAACPDATQDAG